MIFVVEVEFSTHDLLKEGIVYHDDDTRIKEKLDAGA